MSVPPSVHTLPPSPGQSNGTGTPSSDALEITRSLAIPQRTSSLIASLSLEAAGRDVAISDDIALADIVDALKDRSFGAMLILFALPNTVVPGVIFIVGGPIILIGFQLALGYRQPWLPQFMLRRRLRRSTVRAITLHAGRFLAWLEQWLRPRAFWLTSRAAERVLGLYIAGLAVLLITPLPLGATLPAIGISLIAAGLAEKDGAAVALGFAVGLAGAVYAAAFTGGMAMAAVTFVGDSFVETAFVQTLLLR